ncbi:MAG: hypothetical protein Crog4KO_29450 [Crocinitomicaceae bacterium]
MKGKSIILAAALVTQTLAFGANMVTKVDSSQNQATQNAELIMGEASKVLYSLNAQDSNTISIKYAFYKPKNSKAALEPYQITFNEIVHENAMWETLSSFDEELVSTDITTQFFHDRLDTVAAIYSDEQAFNEHSIMWDLLTHTEVLEFKHHISLTISNYSHTGGAHGSSNIQHFLIDRASGELLELSDLFTDTDQVNTLAEVQYRELYDITFEEELSDYDFWFPNDTFAVNENFTIQGNAIVFDFNEYEIAPYYYGGTELVIPLEDLEPFMTEYMKSTLD